MAKTMKALVLRRPAKYRKGDQPVETAEQGAGAPGESGGPPGGIDDPARSCCALPAAGSDLHAPFLAVAMRRFELRRRQQPKGLTPVAHRKVREVQLSGVEIERCGGGRSRREAVEFGQLCAQLQRDGIGSSVCHHMQVAGKLPDADIASVQRQMRLGVPLLGAEPDATVHASGQIDAQEPVEIVELTDMQLQLPMALRERGISRHIAFQVRTFPIGSTHQQSKCLAAVPLERRV